jgi:WD40 repeat protein
VNSLAHIPAHDHDGTSIYPYYYLPANSEEEYIASGGNSTVILLHSLNPRKGEQNLDPEPRQALIGHSLNVSTLEYSIKRQKLISGSWDKTARIWSRSSTEEEDGQGWKCEIVLEEHEEAVWGVLAIDSGPSDGCWLTSSGTFPILFFRHL